MTNDELQTQLGLFIRALKENKPEDKSRLDRNYAICITEAEKLMAFFSWYIVLEE